ncbi:MAG: hypothetical protein ACRDV9_13870, partial [Acidimicrobiia bacterium]
CRGPLPDERGRRAGVRGALDDQADRVGSRRPGSRRQAGRWLVGLWLAAIGPPATAAGGYGPAQQRCHLGDRQIAESSGVASASWSDDVVWTHNDSGDRPRFFAVSTTSCATLAVYAVSGAEAVDWEDMARSERTLYLGDIGDNAGRRPSVTVYEVAEPGADDPAGTVPPTARRVLRYPDGAHDAESLLVDPTTGRLVVVTKVATGRSGVYRAPPGGDGVMEKLAEVTVTGLAPLTTGADATAERIIVRTYFDAYEWDVLPGDTLAGALARRPAPVALPITLQGEAIAYTRDGQGLWTTSESEGAPVHLLRRLLAQAPTPSSAGGDGGAAAPGGGGGGRGALVVGLALAGGATLVALVARRVVAGRHSDSSA